MAHNPAIYRVGDGFVLFYIGSDEGSRYRQIGIATAPAVTGGHRHATGTCLRVTSGAGQLLRGLWLEAELTEHPERVELLAVAWDSRSIRPPGAALTKSGARKASRRPGSRRL